MNSGTTRPELLSTIRDILADVVDNESLQLTEASTAEQVPDWDSINQVKLLIGLENELNFRFSSQEVEGLKNVGALIDLVQRKLAVRT
ncbi:MAG TPA: acyl carrier protein [Rhizomicrobium sp.]|jgi:acyl carrier protein|nr:acyl carrier protein [Rhizomicrobium sp.]